MIVVDFMSLNLKESEDLIWTQPVRLILVRGAWTHSLHTFTL